MAGGVCVHHLVICISQSAVRKTLSKRESRKFQFQDLYMLNVNLGDSSGLRIVVHVSDHFHNSHVLHTSSLYFLYIYQITNACCDVCAWNTNVTSLSACCDVSVCLCIKEQQCH